MKLKHYFLAILAIAMFATTNAQETLTNYVFNNNSQLYHTDANWGWWPNGWFYGGCPWIVGSITSNGSKGLQFEGAGASATNKVGVREVYQYVKLGIGTFEIKANLSIEFWSPKCPFGIRVTDRTGKIIGNLAYNVSPNKYAALDYGPATFTTTVNGTYKYAMYCDSINAGCTSVYKTVSCNQIDGNPYDVGADPYAGINDVKAARCDAYPVGNKIVLSSDEQIETVSIISVNGSLISKVIVKDNNFEMPKPSQKGVYFVKMQTATQNKVVKIQ